MVILFFAVFEKFLEIMLTFLEHTIEVRNVFLKVFDFLFIEFDGLDLRFIIKGLITFLIAWILSSVSFLIVSSDVLLALILCVLQTQLDLIAKIEFRVAIQHFGNVSTPRL